MWSPLLALKDFFSRKLDQWVIVLFLLALEVSGRKLQLEWMFMVPPVLLHTMFVPRCWATGAQQLPGWGLCEYPGAAPALVLPVVNLFNHLQKNCIYLCTALSSSLTAAIAKKRRFDFSFPLCRTAGVYTWTSDRFKVCCLSWEVRTGGIALFQVRTGSLFSPSVHLLFPLPVFCLLFRDWQELSGNDSALALILLFPCAISFGFTILVGGLWQEHTATTWFKGNIKPWTNWSL